MHIRKMGSNESIELRKKCVCVMCVCTQWSVWEFSTYTHSHCIFDLRQTETIISVIYCRELPYVCNTATCSTLAAVTAHFLRRPIFFFFFFFTDDKPSCIHLFIWKIMQMNNIRRRQRRQWRLWRWRWRRPHTKFHIKWIKMDKNEWKKWNARNWLVSIFIVHP